MPTLLPAAPLLLELSPVLTNSPPARARLQVINDALGAVGGLAAGLPADFAGLVDLVTTGVSAISAVLP
jgi:hypothetical protein